MLHEGYRNARILVVAHQDAETESVIQALHQAGYLLVTGICDPGQILATCAAFQPDLFVLAQAGQHARGLGILKQLEPWATKGACPILMLTDGETEESKRSALSSGATDLLSKPFDHVELLLRVRNLLERRFLLRQLEATRSGRGSALLERTQELGHPRMGTEAPPSDATSIEPNEIPHEVTGVDLVRQEELLQTLMDNLPDAIYFKDSFSRFIRVNYEQATRLGLTNPDQAIGKTDFDFFSDEHASEAYEDERRIMETGEPIIEKEERETWPDGRVTWAASTKMPLRGPGGEIIGTFGLSRDVTERKRADQARAEEARLAVLRAEVGSALTRGGDLRRALQECAEALVHGTGVVLARIWSLEPASDMLSLEASAGLYTHINGGHARVPVGKFKIGQIAHRREPHLTNDVQHDPEVADHEWARRERLISFVGHPLVVGDAVVGVIGAFGRQPLTGATLLALSTIADQVAQFIHGNRAEDALRRSERRARLLFNAIPHAAYVFDLDTLNFLEVNRRAIERYGYSRDEFLSMNMSDIRSPEETARLKEHLRSHFAHSDAGEWKHRTRDGRIMDVQSSLHEIEYDGRKAALAIAQDITERKKLEVDLRHSQKLEAVGALAAGIAHEINTPIQFVGDNLRFLQDAFRGVLGLLATYRELEAAAQTAGLEPGLLAGVRQAAEEADMEYVTEEVPKALAQSLDGVDRVATIVKAMKDFARPEQKHKAAADLNQALASTLTVARNEIKYVADVETDFGDLPAVECHLGDLNQVFLNLLVNAAHAVGDVVNGTGQKGTIRVKTRRDGGRVIIEISDTGCGIPEQIRGRVFDPFFTTKQVGRGTGQGLAISRSIVVDKHDGTLTFDSEVGHGTTFFIGLPISNGTGPKAGPLSES